MVPQRSRLWSRVHHLHLCLFIKPRLDAMVCRTTILRGSLREDLSRGMQSSSWKTITHSNREDVDTPMGSWSAT